MKTFEEDNKILGLLLRIFKIEEELGEDNKPVLLSIDKKNRLEDEKRNLLEQYEQLFIELDRIHIRYSPNSKGYVDLTRKLLHDSLNLKTLWGHNYTEILEYHEQGDLLDRGKFLSNYYKLKPPYVKVGTRIPQGIQGLYHESRWCYVYGQYSACIAMSRSVIETVLKHMFNLEGNLEVIIYQAGKNKLLSEEAKDNADKVRKLANKILHRAKVATEKEARDCLDYVLKFIEEICFPTA